MGKLTGKIAVVTGGSNGIGFATAKRFVAEGAHVYITGRRQEELDAAVKKIGSNVTGVQGDVSKLADLDRLYTQVKSEKGKVDVLFANAGVYAFSPIADVTEDHYYKMFDVNVKGLIFTVQKALPLFSDGGSIIFNGSVAGIKGMAGTSVYSATKGAVRSLARTLASDLKDRKIRVNVVSPGPVETEGFDALAGANKDQMVAGMTAGIPLGRTGTPDEIASVALFLASADSAYVNGVDLRADGGFGQV